MEGVERLTHAIMIFSILTSFVVLKPSTKLVTHLKKTQKKKKSISQQILALTSKICDYSQVIQDKNHVPPPKLLATSQSDPVQMLLKLVCPYSFIHPTMVCADPSEHFLEQAEHKPRSQYTQEPVGIILGRCF